MTQDELVSGLKAKVLMIPSADAFDQDLITFAYRIFGIAVHCAHFELNLHSVLLATFGEDPLAVYPGAYCQPGDMPMVRCWNRNYTNKRRYNTEWEVDFYTGKPVIKRKFWF